MEIEQSEELKKIRRHEVLRRKRYRCRHVVRGESACYHLISRTAFRDYKLKEVEKEVLVKMIRKHSTFSNVEVLSYVVMSNHFHLLVRVKHEVSVSDATLLKRYKALYAGDKVPPYAFTVDEVKAILTEGGNDAVELRKRLIARMNDVSVFMRELKQRFSIWYNMTHGNVGTVWAQRFKSQLIEDAKGALSVLAAYIDLNPVRAELADDPADYRYCSYAEAMGGGDFARRALMSLFRDRNWNRVIEAYRMILFGKGYKVKGKDKHKDKGSISPERVREVVAEGGKVSIAEALRCQSRYFSKSQIIGSEQFLIQQSKNSETLAYGAKTKQLWKMQGAEWGDLCTLGNSSF